MIFDFSEDGKMYCTKAMIDRDSRSHFSHVAAPSAGKTKSESVKSVMVSVGLGPADKQGLIRSKTEGDRGRGDKSMIELATHTKGNRKQTSACYKT